MRIEKIFFTTEDGLNLTGLLHTSESKNETEIIISVHGMGSNCLKKRDDVIARKVTDNGISYFTFNNRGQGLINSISTDNGKINQGTVFEDVSDSYFDICAAIEKMKKLGYKKIHLLGHSLGSTKVVYTYNRCKRENNTEILSNIKSVLLLSLVDIVDVMSLLNNVNPNIDVMSIAREKEEKGLMNYIIETGVPFMPFVSVKTFLKYYRDNENIDFARYTKNDFEYNELNNIEVPIFMRWGNVKELISLPADEVVKICNSKIKNVDKDISFIDGASHNYAGREDCLAKEIMNFIHKVNY